MKKFLKSISVKLKNSLNLINREKLEGIVPYLLPEFWASNKEPFLLFWFIGLFTIIFLIWASIAEVNQVVRAPGTVIPDSKVHLVQSGIAGPVEKINVKLDDDEGVDSFSMLPLFSNMCFKDCIEKSPA